MTSFYTNKIYVMLALCSFITSLFFGYIYLNTSIQEYRIKGESSDRLNLDLLPLDYRRRLADKIAKIQLEIARIAGANADIVDAKLALQLSEIVAELDIRQRSSSKLDSKWDFSARLPFMGPASNTTSDGKPRHVCPEVYKHNRSFPLLSSMCQETCTYVPKFHKTLTVLLLSQSCDPEDLNVIANRITKYYDIGIVMLVKNYKIIMESRSKNVTYLEVKHKESDSDAVSRAMKLIKTPFVLIGNSLSQFNKQSSLERLVRVLDELPLVKVAGGAARDSQGRWIHGCLQQKMENYHATYDLGYYSSKYECMYCDNLLTPFVAHTKIFQQVPLEKGLNGSIVFFDWFVRVRLAGYLAVSCPDVMFYVHSHPIMTTFDWRKFAQIWSLNRIQTYNGTVIEFSCFESKIRCKGINSLVRKFLIPPCCLEIILEEIGYILDFADKNNMHYELESGTVLGAVKLGTHLPWDPDMDINFACKDLNIWKQMKNEYLKKKKCKMSYHKKNKFVIHCPKLRYEFYCHSSEDNMSRVMIPEEFINNPTKINFGGRWRSAVSNPGLYSRNLYGIEDLRHVPRRREVKPKTEEEKFKPGAWNKCSIPNHHACLDHFPTDGSLQFLKR